MSKNTVANEAEVCVSLVAAPKFRHPVAVEPEDVLQVQSLEEQNLLHLTPLSAVISTLKNVQRSLLALNHHPVDHALIGISGDYLQQMRIVLARLSSRQARLDAANLEEETEQEAELTRKLATNLTPLVAKISKNQVTAEAAMRLINMEHDPAKARRVLVTQHSSPATIFQGSHMIAKADSDALHQNIKLKGDQAHHIQITIQTLDFNRQLLQARLIKTIAPSDLFDRDENGRRQLILTVYDTDNFFLLSQCATLGLSANISATFDVSLSARGCTFTGSLLNIKDREQLVQNVRLGVSERAASLFT